MAALTVTKNLGDLKVLFNQIKEVYLFKDINKAPSALTAADMELPIISDGVSFNTGQPDVTKVKLTTKETWTSMADAGDSDISFQVGTFADEVSKLFLNQIGAEATMGSSIDGATYKGFGFSLEPKKVSCGLLLCSQDKQVAIFLPNVEIFASVVVEQGKPGYFDLVCTPLESIDGIAIYFLKKGSEAA